METLKYNDKNAVELKVNDNVRVSDIERLEDCNELKENAILIVSKLLDLESNYIEFICENKTYEFYGHRVIKINS